jgi:AcrR family transcriptional regulator
MYRENDMTQREAGLAQEASDLRLGNSTDPRAIRTRKAIQDGFLALLDAHPFEQITPQQITAAAGVARQSFYLHYPSKDALLHDLAHDAIVTMHRLGMEALDQGGSKAAALSNCHYVEENRTLWAVLLNGGARAFIREEQIRLARAVSAERSIPNDALPNDLGPAFSAGAMVEIIAWWLRQEEGRYSAEFVADLMIDLVFNPIRMVSTSPKLRFSHVDVHRDTA